MILKLIPIDPLSPWLGLNSYYISSTEVYLCNPSTDLGSMGESTNIHLSVRLMQWLSESWMQLYYIYVDDIQIIDSLWSIVWIHNPRDMNTNSNGGSWSRDWSELTHYNLGWALISTVDQVQRYTPSTPLVTKDPQGDSQASTCV